MAKNELKQDLEKVDQARVKVATFKQGEPEVQGATVEDLVGLVCIQLNIDTTAGKQFVRHSLANALLMNRKQHDYGPGNIAKFMTAGVIMRISDKMERLCNLFNGGRRKKAINESIQDNLRDLGNYGVIGQMCENGDWPKE